MPEFDEKDEPTIIRMKEMQKQRELLLELYHKNQKIAPYFDYHLLFQGILDSLPLLSTKDMDQCILNRIPDDGEPSFVQCEMGKLYKTFPRSDDELQNIQQLFLHGKGKINEGGLYGLMVQSSIKLNSGKEEAVVVKIPKKWSGETILEAFVNFYIINRFVKTIHDLGYEYAQLVSSYGFFTCNQKNSTSPCDEPTNINDDARDNSYLYLIQQYIPSSISLGEYLDSAEINRNEILRVMIKIFRTLDILQQSEFKINHMDLHPGNILIGVDDDRKWNGKVWIIDWARASFTYENKRFENENSAIGEFYTEFTAADYDKHGDYWYPKLRFQINGALHDFNKIMITAGLNKTRIDLLYRLFPQAEYQDFIKDNSELLNIWRIAGNDRMTIVDRMKDWTYAKILIYLQLILNNPDKNIIDLINVHDFYDFRDAGGINFEGIDITDLDLRGVDVSGTKGIRMFGMSRMPSRKIGKRKPKTRRI
jgi:hypothetical protein